MVAVRSPSPTIFLFGFKFASKKCDGEITRGTTKIKTRLNALFFLIFLFPREPPLYKEMNKKTNNKKRVKVYIFSILYLVIKQTDQWSPGKALPRPFFCSDFKLLRRSALG